MNAITKIFLSMTGIADKLPLAGLRTYIVIFFLALQDILPKVMIQINSGGSLTDIEFLWSVGSILFVAITGMLTKNAAVVNAKKDV